MLGKSGQGISSTSYYMYRIIYLFLSSRDYYKFNRKFNMKSTVPVHAIVLVLFYQKHLNETLAGEIAVLICECPDL